LLVDFADGSRTVVAGLPEMFVAGDAGLHDAERHPDFADNGWIYISYSVGEEFHSTLALSRIRLEGSQVSEHQLLFTAEAWSESQTHYGGRIQFQDGYLFLTVGDRFHRDEAQDRSNHIGTIVRLRDDGSVPEDNPFVESEEGRSPPLPEIWSYGHRNPQGLYADQESGVLWAHEHGPRGGDELNRIEAGANYGWPIVSFGFEYSGGPIYKGITQEEGMTQPVWVYVPSIAPSDLVFYEGDAFPDWQGSLLIGSLAYTHLNRLAIEDGAVVLEERIARGDLGRIRAIAVDDAGLVYLGSDLGQIWRLRPE
jgi:glucose/arabinose dehydrogenase